MSKKYSLEKLDCMEEMLPDFSEKAHGMFNALCEDKDICEQEEIKLLSDVIYTEGFIDGMLFFNYLTERAR